MAKQPKFHCKSEAQKKAIRRNYARSSRSELLEMSERYRSRNLGALEFGGKIYDTNFKGKPTVISKKEIAELRESYDPDGRMSDLAVADSYVRHMRRKFGVFDENNKFLGMLSEQ